jgi:cytidylate kinase
LPKPLVLIVLSGQIGSGKSTIASHFKKQGFAHIHLGQFFKEQAKAHNMTFINYMTQLENTIGEEGKSKMLMKHVAKIANKNQGVVIESAYSRSFIESLRLGFRGSNIFVVSVAGKKRVRVQRVAKRERLPSKKALRLVSFWDMKRKQLGINYVQRLSDLIVDNTNLKNHAVGQVVEHHVRTGLINKLVSVLKRAGRR